MTINPTMGETDTPPQNLRHPGTCMVGVTLGPHHHPPAGGPLTPPEGTPTGPGGYPTVVIMGGFRETAGGRVSLPCVSNPRVMNATYVQVLDIEQLRAPLDLQKGG